MKKMMLIAAVAAAGVAVAAGLGPQNYVQAGLVTHLDAIDNEGTGTHNPSATTWRDLKGSAYVTLTGGACWTDRYFDSTPEVQQLSSMPAYYRNSVTIETAITVISNNTKTSSTSWPRIFNGPGCTLHSEGNTSTSFRFYLANAIPGDNNSQRPTTGSFRTATVSCYSGSDYFAVALDAVQKQKTSKPATASLSQPAQGWQLNGNDGYLHGHYYAFRMYNRMLSMDEITTNTVLDKLRFFSYTYTGTGAAENWGDIAWTIPERATVAAPSTQTNAYAQLVSVTANVAAADNVGLAGLSLEDGATLNIAADAIAAVKVLYVEGVAVPRGVYTGTGPVGTQVNWLSGDGILGVAGSLNRGVPSLVPTPAADGWYEFGLASGYAHGYDLGWSASVKYHYIIGDRPIWDAYAFPAGAKLRLVGGILLETVPAGVFSQYDMSGLKIVYLHGATAFADGTALTVPNGAIFRYQPGTWKPDASVANKWWLSAKSDDTVTYTGDIVNNGQMNVTGDGTQSPYQIFTGHISGTGGYYSTNFGKQGRFQGRYDLSGTLSGFQCGSLIWLDTLSIGGKFTTAAFSDCAGQWATDGGWCANGLMLGKNNSDATADNELKIDTLTGRGYSTTASNGKRWRRGGHAIIWGYNTLHVGELYSGLHVMARGGDQNCSKGWLTSSVGGKGTGNIIIDKFTSGDLFCSTNINVLVGQVVAASTFDYTYQSNAVNRMTLDITNTCNASAIVKATDIGMLPARVSGFKGTVTLTDTATVKSYTMPVDVTHGTNYLYNTTGCIGSGRLAGAPASGTINVTFPTTGDKPVRGKYALARFTSGGELLANWTVTQNGQAVEATVVTGMEIRTKKDATGLWLDVREPGVRFIIR